MTPTELPRRALFPRSVDATRVTYAGAGTEGPAKDVVWAAEGAGLLVVGWRKHRPALAPRLDPVAEAAVHHARCPVSVFPP